MEFGALATLGVVIVVVSAITSRRIGVAAPLILVLLGVGIGYFPFVPLIEVDPQIILLGVLPPLLYASAVNVPLIDFRRNFKPVAGLSVLLVIITALIVGFAIHLVFPFIPLAVSIALGAVISPTDAVAATSIGKKLGMPPRVVAILEGESLVNDATSLVLLKTAIAGVFGSFSFWDSAATFAYSVAAALAVGLLVGSLTVWLRSLLSNPIHDTAISFIVPFAAFIPAEELGASGVLAVVVTGLFAGHHAAKRFSVTARFNERLNWRTLQFVLENGVFLVMGLQMHSLVGHVSASRIEFEHIGLAALGLIALLILCRAAFVIPLLLEERGAARRYAARSADYSRRKARLRARREPAADSKQKHLRRLQLMQRRSEADLAHAQAQSLGWRDGVVLSWSGMRGVVTLAAAQSIPSEVPFRAEAILVAFLVAIGTLLLHGLSLPLLIRRLWPAGRGEERFASELENLCLDLIERGDAALDDALAETAKVAGRELPSDDVIAQVRDEIRQALAGITPLGLTDPEEEHRSAPTFAELSRAVVEAQQQTILEERAVGNYSSRALRTAALALDAEELRLAQLS